MQAPDLPLVHVVAGMVTANRNRAPVILIASQIIWDELGFDFIQEVDFKQVYRNLSETGDQPPCGKRCAVHG